MPHKDSEENRQMHVDNLRPSLQDGATFFLLTVAAGLAMREIGLPPPCLSGTVFVAAPLATLAHEWRVRPSKEWLTQNSPQK